MLGQCLKVESNKNITTRQISRKQKLIMKTAKCMNILIHKQFKKKISATSLCCCFSLYATSVYASQYVCMYVCTGVTIRFHTLTFNPTVNEPQVFVVVLGGVFKRYK